MYKRHSGQISLFDEPEFFGTIPLNPKNELMRLIMRLFHSHGDSNESFVHYCPITFGIIQKISSGKKRLD